MYKGTLVLEGGATRGVFTAGMLDSFMEKNFKISNIYGVSAGACNAVDFTSRQIGRTKDCMIVNDKENGYISLRKFVTEGELIDMEKIVNVFALETFPFDFDTYFASDIITELIATNCLTGKAEGLAPETKEELLDMVRASSSMPLIEPIVHINNIPYLDGGIGCGIPVEYVLSKNLEKNVFLLTRQKGYRKDPGKSKLMPVISYMYKDYPNLIRSIGNVSKRYNLNMDMIDKLEEEGKIFVIRPIEKPVGRFEQDPEKLTAFFNHGYEIGESIYPDLIKYLEA